MRKLWALLLPLAMFAQTHPDLSGVWKADKDKSQTARPLGENDYYVWLTASGNAMTEKTMLWGPHADQRMEMKYDLSGGETTGTEFDRPVKTKATWDGNSLVIETTRSGRGGRAMTSTQTWTLSPSGKELTLVTKGGFGGGSTYVFEKQPESAAEVFSQPPKPASEIYKNLQVLGGMPGSAILPAMRAFAQGLGVECEFCHVRGGFDKDDNPHKLVARKMIRMAMAINKDNFGGRMEVTCYTCHRGKEMPLKAPPQAPEMGGAH
jgi:Photosynthetic reaction centre cytochrome C subunit